MIQTVFFDGCVIVDTEPNIDTLIFKSFTELNIDVTEVEFISFTGNSTNVFQNLKQFLIWSRMLKV
jgi:hypothetical protein